MKNTKRIILTIMAILPLMATAETFDAIYKSISTELTISEIASSPAKVESIVAQYEQKAKASNAEMMRLGQRLQVDQQTYLQYEQSRPKASAAQKQASKAVVGDMMLALSAAGISPEKMATMSEEELMEVLMPIMAQKIGLSAIEMQAIQGMSDKEAEAYMMQKGRAERVQNSDYVQKAAILKGMPKGLDLSEHPEGDKVLQCQTAHEQLSEFMREKSATIIASPMPSLNDEELEVLRKPFEARIEFILKELYARIEKEPNYDGGNGIKMPAYGKSYYDRINSVVEEYNLMIATKWAEMHKKQIAECKSYIAKYLPIFIQSEYVYNGIKDPIIKALAGTYCSQSNVINVLLQRLIQLESSRISAPVIKYYEMPAYIGGMG